MRVCVFFFPFWWEKKKRASAVGPENPTEICAAYFLKEMICWDVRFALAPPNVSFSPRQHPGSSSKEEQQMGIYYAAPP
jgi:hypothetical protein